MTIIENGKMAIDVFTNGLLALEPQGTTLYQKTTDECMHDIALLGKHYGEYAKHLERVAMRSFIDSIGNDNGFDNAMNLADGNRDEQERLHTSYKSGTLTRAEFDQALKPLREQRDIIGLQLEGIVADSKVHQNQIDELSEIRNNMLIAHGIMSTLKSPSSASAAIISLKSTGDRLIPYAQCMSHVEDAHDYLT